MTTVITASSYGRIGTLLTITATVVDGPPEVVLTGDHWRKDRRRTDRVNTAVIKSGSSAHRCRVELHLDQPEIAPPAEAAIAVAAIAASAGPSAGLAALRLAGTAVLGDVDLDSSLRQTNAVLPAVHAARAHRIPRVIVPADSLDDTAHVADTDVLGAHTLADIAEMLLGNNDALLRTTMAQRNYSL